MNIYTSGANPFNTPNVTPAHVYAGTSDFADILADMEKGNLPVGTRQPFPVNFENEDGLVASPSPWTTHNSTMLDDPPSRHVVGPRTFNL